MGTWNMRSINGKEDEIIEEMKMQDIEYLGIAETKKDKDWKNSRMATRCIGLA